jgi:hypothetical protein
MPFVDSSAAAGPQPGMQASRLMRDTDVILERSSKAQGAWSWNRDR